MNTPTSVAVADRWSSRVDEFTRILSEVAADERGLFRTHIHFSERRALRASDLPDSVPLTPAGLSGVEFFCYEDCAMTTGAFLAGQSIRYEITGAREAVELAQKAFDGICYIYELGREIRPGFFPKPYGGRTSREFSRDQYLFVLSGLAAYSRICSAEHRARIATMAATMMDFWMGIDYRQKYFNLPEASNLGDFMAPLFLGMASLCHRLGGEERHEREYRRLFQDEALGRRMPATLRAQFRAGVAYDGAMYFRQAENAMMMKCMAIDEVWESDSVNRPLWRKSLQCFLDDDLTVALDREDGLTFGLVGYNREDDSVYLVDPRVVEELENPLNLPDLTWGGRRKRPGSAQTAYAAAVIAGRTGSEEAREVLELILDRMTYDSFRFVTVPDPDHFVPDHAWEHDLLATTQMAYWLWSYWLGRQRGMLTEGAGRDGRTNGNQEAVIL